MESAIINDIVLIANTKMETSRYHFNRQKKRERDRQTTHRINMEERKLPLPVFFSSEFERIAFYKNRNEQSRLFKTLHHIDAQQLVTRKSFRRDAREMRAQSAKYAKRIQLCKVNRPKTADTNLTVDVGFQSLKSRSFEKPLNEACVDKMKLYGDTRSGVFETNRGDDKHSLSRRVEIDPNTHRVPLSEYSDKQKDKISLGLMTYEKTMKSKERNQEQIKSHRRITPKATMIKIILPGQGTKENESLVAFNEESDLSKRETLSSTMKTNSQIEKKVQIRNHSAFAVRRKTPETDDQTTGDRKLVRVHSAQTQITMTGIDRTYNKISNVGFNNQQKGNTFLTINGVSKRDSSINHNVSKVASSGRRRSSFFDTSRAVYELKKEVRRNSCKPATPDVSFNLGNEIEKEKRRFSECLLKIEKYVTELKTNAKESKLLYIKGSNKRIH